MHTLNGKIRGWWDDICLVVWGPSSKLLSIDIELQDYIKKIIEEGVEVVACKAYADSYGVSLALENIDIEAKYMWESLTDYLKKDWKTITF